MYTEGRGTRREVNLYTERRGTRREVNLYTEGRERKKDIIYQSRFLFSFCSGFVEIKWSFLC